jgi:glycerate-2-kinase
MFSPSVCGEARDEAERLVLHAKKRIESGLSQPTAILSGGETTVTIRGTGSGGRNQEMALAFAIAAEKHRLKGKWTFLSGGTDGRDGPTDAAGGMVDPETLTRIKKARANPLNRLNNNDSYSALKKSEDLVITGATGTNVADLQIILIQPE